MADLTQASAYKWTLTAPEESYRVYIQYKGTDICMDFHCECGNDTHFDGDFTYAVRCPYCKGVYELSSYINTRKLTPEEEAKNKGVVVDLPPNLDFYLQD